MSTEIIKIISRDAWLKERAKDITSTEVSALYGLNPYVTEFELFHQKRDNVIIKLEENERMKWGNRLESAIAYGAAEDMGWRISKFDVYMRDLEVRMGSSFDFQIDSSSQGPGILEVKNVDRLQYAKKWLDDGTGHIEAPEHIEMQVQHQMEVSGYEWAAIVVLVGGNEQKIILRNRDRDVGKHLRERVSQFWKAVAANAAPSPDYTRDAEYIISQLKQADEGVIAEADVDLVAMIEEYNLVNSAISNGEKVKTELKAKILSRIGTASKVLTPFGTLSCGNVKGRSGTLITADMVGTVIGATEGHRNFRFFTKKGA